MSGQWRLDPENRDRDYTVWQYRPTPKDKWGVVELHYNPPEFFQSDYDKAHYFEWEVYLSSKAGNIKVPDTAKTLRERKAWAVAMWRMR